jgi:hypothetical protein
VRAFQATIVQDRVGTPAEIVDSADFLDPHLPVVRKDKEHREHRVRFAAKGEFLWLYLFRSVQFLLRVVLWIQKEHECHR